MVAKKKSVSSGKKKISSEVYDDLYVNMADAKEKRKSILLSIKNSLVMQEEYDQIVVLRKQKAKTLTEIKKSMEKLNKDYQNLRKLLPNVKNVISYTQKELQVLDDQIDMLKADIHSDDSNIEIDKSLKSSIKDKKPITKRGDDILDKKNTNQTKQEVVRPQVDNKLTRIQNNLKVIESKLKGL